MTGTLLDHHDAVLLDLDGTVYRGGRLVPGAGEAIGAAHGGAAVLRYVTNNASKPPEAIARQLTDFGLAAESTEVSTSAQAAAALLAAELPPEAPVLVVGAAALESEIRAVGLSAVREHSENPAAVVQGHSPETSWRDLAEACLAIRAGALWVASNDDATLPGESGELPGNGAMVAALTAATGRTPRVAGKPQRPLLDRAVDSAGGTRPVMVGDRLETDIAGAVRARMPSLMVLTGVSTPVDLLAAAEDSRPDYVASDLAALHRAPAESAIGEHPAWKVRVRDRTLTLASATAPEVAPLPALRALCSAWWAVGSGPVRVRGDDDDAREALRRLQLTDAGAPRLSTDD